MQEGRRGPRLNINLEFIGVRLGDVLTHVDTKGQTCVVVALNPPRVLHRGQVKSLTQACNDVYEITYNDPAAVWMYNGESLRQRRERFERYHR